jgi:Ca2+-binding EF-hand superfamily protein
MPFSIFEVALAKEALTKVAPKVNEALEKTGDELVKLLGRPIEAYILDLLNSILYLLYTAGVLIGQVIGEVAVGKEIGEREARKRERPEILPPDVLTTLYFRRLIPEKTFIEEMAKHGFKDEDIERFKQAAEQLTPVDVIIKETHLGRLREEQARNLLRQHGFSDDAIDRIFDASFTPLSPDIYIQAWLRGLISERMLEFNLKYHQLGDSDIEILKQMAYVIPPISDIIRMAVREAFTPSIAEKFGQYEDFPEEFAHWVEKQGLSREWAERYWAAHWELPSAQMGFEMLHRGIITEDELKMLLRALDIMPFWREKLIQLSYVPLTRVDVRRMYQMGILNRDQVKKAYKDLGYNEENAEYLTRFTEALATEDVKELSKAEILSAYNDRIISRQEAQDMLRSLGYSDHGVEILLAIQDYKREKELRDRRISVIKTRYMKHVIDETRVRIELTALALPAEEIDYYVETWTHEREAKGETLSLSDVKMAYQKGVITKEEFIARLLRMGYNEEDASIILQITRKGGL